jgi:hypothetical protein
MSIFEYELTRPLNGDPTVNKHIEILATFFLIPVGIRGRMVELIRNDKVLTNKKAKTKQGKQLFKWYMDNPVILYNGYEYESWPLIDHYKENEESIIVFRNTRLEGFFKELGGALKGIDKDDQFTVTLSKRNAARFYAHWLIKGKPLEMGLTFQELIVLFNAEARMYTSIAQLENRVLKNCIQDLLNSNLIIQYQKDKERKNQKLFFKITEI